jgi:hypothetical protein
MLPTTGDTILITELVVKLYKCELTSKFLQSHDAHKVTLLSVRMAFDRLIAQIPGLAAKLGPDADVIHSHAFEKAVIKLQKGENLSPVYKAQVAMFKEVVVLPAEGKEEELPFEEIIARAVEASKTQALRSATGYRSTLHISPTSNIIERLFSRASIIMRPHRRCMDPSTCEMLIMLRCNKDLWSNKTLQDIIDRKKEFNREATRNRREEQELQAAHDREVLVFVLSCSRYCTVLPFFCLAAMNCQYIAIILIHIIGMDMYCNIYYCESSPLQYIAIYYLTPL